MKKPILAVIFVALTGALASAAEFSVFRVCQDQRVIRTSDGAEAGRVEYIVVDPSSREVVSTVVSGGVIGERLVAIPYASLRFNGDREITLNEITRERLVSAPVIERSQISTSVIEPSVIERTRTHFSARVEGAAGASERNAIEGGAAVNGRANDPRLKSGTARNNDPNAQTAPGGSADAEARRQQAERKSGALNQSRPNAEAEANRERERTDAKAGNKNALNEKEKETADSTPAKAKKGNAARPENNAETNQPHGAAPADSTKPTRDTNNRSKAQQAEREPENAKAQQNEPANTKGDRKGAADRNANEQSATGRKPAEENAEATSKHSPKKANESSEEKRSEEKRPQL